MPKHFLNSKNKKKYENTLKIMIFKSKTNAQTLLKLQSIFEVQKTTYLTPKMTNTRSTWQKNIMFFDNLQSTIFNIASLILKKIEIVTLES